MQVFSSSIALRDGFAVITDLDVSSGSLVCGLG